MITAQLFRTAKRHWVIPSNSRMFLPLARTAHQTNPTTKRGNSSSAKGRERRDQAIESIVKRLQPLGSGPLCDADKAHLLAASAGGDPDAQAYAGIRLVCPKTMKRRNAAPHAAKMIGVARTVRLTRPNDFLAVLHALSEVRSGDVLVVDAGGSTRAVAGGLFATEAARRGAGGIVVDGPIRDVEDLACPAYSTSVSPYSGTVQYPGEGIDVAPVLCGGVMVAPGDIVFGDGDGVLVGSAETFATCLETAENVVSLEQQLMKGMKMGVGLHAMTNFEKHMKKRREGKESTIEFYGPKDQV